MSAVSARLGRVPHLRASLVLFAGVLLVYLATGRQVLLGTVTDALYTSAPAWKLGQFHTLNIDDFPLYGQWTMNVDGHLRSDRFPGAILFATPFYWLGGHSTFSVTPGVVSAGVSSAIAVLFFHRTLLRIVAPTTALIGALLLAFGTSMWTVAAHELWTHGPTLMGLSIATWAMSRSDFVTAGLGYAVAILSRPHTAIIAAVVGVWESVVRREIWPAVKIGLASALGLLGLLLWNHVNANRWTLLPGTYGNRADVAVSGGASGQAKGSLWIADLAGTFGSPLRGVFVLSPFLLLLLPGVRAAWKDAPAWVRSSAVAGLVYLVLQLAGNGFTGGYGFFGYRVSLEPVFLAGPLLAIAGERWTATATWSRVTFGALACVTVGWFAIATKQFVPDPKAVYTWRSWDVSTIVRDGGVGAVLGAAVFVAILAWIVRTYARDLAATEANVIAPSVGTNQGPQRAPRRRAKKG